MFNKFKAMFNKFKAMFSKFKFRKACMVANNINNNFTNTL